MNPATMSLPSDAGKIPAAVLAVVVHVLLFSFLVFGLRWSAKAPDAVVVELWRAPAVEPEPTAEPVPDVKPESEPRRELKPVPRIETPPPKPVLPRKPDIVVEKEKKPVPRREEPKLQIDARVRMQEELARETQALARDRQRPPAPTVTSPPPAAPQIDAAYSNRIMQKIKGNIVLPQGIPGNPEATVEVVQLPTGEVLSVKFSRSSGHRALDEAIERAILKSSPLPRPDNPAHFQRQLLLKYRYLD